MIQLDMNLKSAQTWHYRNGVRLSLGNIGLGLEKTLGLPYYYALDLDWLYELTKQRCH